MKLLIISNMAHYLRGGEIVGWGPTVQEIHFLTHLFEEVRHIACLHTSEAPNSALPYESDRIHLVPVPPAGGTSFRDKLEILRLTPLYIRSILKELPKADIVHVRCPANISLIAVILLAFVRKPRIRWVKYAGNWSPNIKDSWSYRLQRWWLNRKLHQGVVTINGRWPNQPSHVHSFLNPCLSQVEVEEARIEARNKRLNSPVRLLFVGYINENKGLGIALQTTERLRAQGISLIFDIVGDGYERTKCEQLAGELGLNDVVRFHGWIPRTQIGGFYQSAHFLLLPTDSEGWPKVVSEAMAYGVIPIVSKVSSIPQVLAEIGCGLAVSRDSEQAFVDGVKVYLDNPRRWQDEAERGRNFANQFTYEEYGLALDRMFQKAWGISLLSNRTMGQMSDIGQ
jgi:glycosyltransferase involved in cell wall biosynthesis